jgi:hypothetical protein
MDGKYIGNKGEGFGQDLEPGKFFPEFGIYNSLDSDGNLIFVGEGGAKKVYTPIEFSRLCKINPWGDDSGCF